MGNILKIYHLKDEALMDLYERLDNDIDALRHAYISGVYTIEYNEGTAELMGRLNELSSFDSQSTSDLSENMDLWNNDVGRFYGNKAKTWDDLYSNLMEALKSNELIIDLKDTRKYKGDKRIKRIPKTFVIKIKENKTGANTEFLDIRKKVIMSKKEFVDAMRNGLYPGYAIRKHHSGEFPYSTRDSFSFNYLG